MTKKLQSITPIILQDLEKVDDKCKRFTEITIGLNALACNNSSSDHFDMAKAERIAQNGLEALGATGGLQEMVAAQMLSIHQLQQKSMALANEPAHIETMLYFLNAGIKLANAFVQQAHLLNKLQGNGDQKIIVEHVEVHKGGQAIVGNINGGSVKK